MNNDQFRRLLLNNSGASNSNQDAAKSATSASQGTAAQSRKSVFGSMTPRTVRRNGSGTNDYGFSSKPTDQNKTQQKKQKSSAPRGVKLADGYRDRALERLNAEKEGRQEDEKLLKLKDLAEQVRSGKLSVTEFERLSQEVAGGDVTSTHLVRGLDRKLLERVRRGDDVAQDDEKPIEGAENEVDDEFDELETKDVQRLEKQDREKTGRVAKAPAPIAGQKRTRDDIIRELKAKRQAEAEAKLAARPDLGDKFKSADRRPEVKITIDSKGREVIYTRDENGKLKKKVRKVTSVPEPAMQAPVKPDVTRSKHADIVAADDDDDSAPEVMFEDAGSDYNPFGNNDDDDDSDSSQDDGEEQIAAKPRPKTRSSSPSGSSDAASAHDQDHQPASAVPPPTAPRNYFSTGKDEPSSTDSAAPSNPFADTTFLSAISRAADLAKAKDAQASDDHPDGTEEARHARLETEARLKKKREAMMASSARDLEDMDMGFGGGRFDDDDDDNGDERIKLSEWKDGAADDDEEDGGGGKHGKGGGGKRKRPGKKPKGDKNDARNVLEVMRRRQNA